MKNYNRPELAITIFDAEDIVTASGVEKTYDNINAALNTAGVTNLTKVNISDVEFVW